jgi:DNA/RNA-binding domain of Phe-tRNA-synthetase-like protein
MNHRGHGGHGGEEEEDMEGEGEVIVLADDGQLIAVWPYLF